MKFERESLRSLLEKSLRSLLEKSLGILEEFLRRKVEVLQWLEESFKNRCFCYKWHAICHMREAGCRITTICKCKGFSYNTVVLEELPS